MKAVILAAGYNRRFEGIIDGPKTLLKVGEESILERQVNILTSAGFLKQDIFVVTGYKHERVAEVHNNTIFNEKYLEKDNAYSVYLALKHLIEEIGIANEEQILIFDGDLVYDKNLLNELITFEKPNVLVTKETAFEKDTIKDETMIVNENGEIEKMIIPPKGTFLTSDYKDEKLFVYSGIIKLSVAKARELLQALTPEYWGTWYTIPLPRIVNRGGFFNLALPKTLKFCFDVDKKEDLVYLQKQVEQANKMFVAGPVNVSDAVKQATVYSEIGHREKEFEELFSGVKQKLLKVFGGGKVPENYGCFVVGGSGTSATECLLSSVLHNHKKTLIVSNGAFGDRLAEICDVYKIPRIKLDYGWGGYPDLGEIEKTIQENPSIEAIAMVLMETSTGMLNPVKKIGNLCKKYGKACIVDAISALGGEELDVMRDNVDYCLTNTNKCLGGLPVLGIVCYNKSTLQQSKDVVPRSYYLDLFKYVKYADKNQTPFTPQIPLFYMLNQALDDLLNEGLGNRISRYKRNGDLLKSKLRQMGIKFQLKEDQMSNLMVNVLTPPGMTYEQIHDSMKGKGYVFYPGKGPLEGKVLHFANIGTLVEEDVERFIGDLRQTLIDIANDLKTNIDEFLKNLETSNSNII